MAKKKTPTPARKQAEIGSVQLLEMEAKWKRALADYQNLEKRIRAQQSLYARLAGMALIEKLLPILDDLKRASEHLKNEGLEIVIKQFLKVINDEGVMAIEAYNQVFDPQTMECVEMVDGEANRVTEVIEDGYCIGETVIRPAKVKVGKGN